MTNLEKQKAEDLSISQFVKESMHKGEVFALAVDTSIYVINSTTKEISLTRSWQDRIFMLADKGLKYVIPTIWDCEISRFIETSVKLWAGVYTPPTSVPLGDAALVLAAEKMDGLIRYHRTNSKETALNLWNLHKERCNAQIVDAPNNCLSDVISRFKEERPPFVKGKKQDEFADAFALEALVHYSRENSGMKIVVVSQDAAVRDYCKEENGLVGFWCVERALDALTTKEEIERLKIVSHEISILLSDDSVKLCDSLTSSLLSLPQLSAYNGNNFHLKIDPSFQPYIHIVSVENVQLVPCEIDGNLVRVQAEQNGSVSLTGKANFQVLAGARVSAVKPGAEDRYSMELELLEPAIVSFELRFDANRESGADFWSANVHDEGRGLFELPLPPTGWVASPHA